jgi:hypothetical protein
MLRQVRQVADLIRLLLVEALFAEAVDQALHPFLIRFQPAARRGIVEVLRHAQSVSIDHDG